MNTRTGLLLVLALAVGLVAQGTAGAAVARRSPAKVPDAKITQRIENALTSEPLLENTAITVTTKDGTVRLSGQVSELAAKQTAESIVEKIDGVRMVRDEIEVVPPARRDAEIMRDIERRFEASPQIQPGDLGVAVQGGIVTLTGAVKNRVEAQEAEFLASGVIGVREVVDEVRSLPISKRSDADILSDALKALDRDGYLHGLPLSVDVQNGVATLDGTVGTVFQERRAVMQVISVPGIEGLDIQLTIDPSAVPSKPEAERSLTDDGIEENVMAALEQDPRVDATNVTVSASDGNVTLAGWVPTAYQSVIAKRDAHEVVGVVRLDDKLTVRSQDRPDEAIQSDVRALLDSDALLGASKIDVAVKDGVVTLSGKVDNGFEKNYAENLALRPLGVWRVDDKLDVASDSATNSDEQIQRLISDRIAWDWVTSWVEPQISVEVHDGVAMLSGDVDTWSQRLEAARVALSVPGVRQVNDDLSVLGQFTGEDFYYPGDFLLDPWSQLYGPQLWP